MWHPCSHITTTCALDTQYTSYMYVNDFRLSIDLLAVCNCAHGDLKWSCSCKSDSADVASDGTALRVVVHVRVAVK